MWNDPAEEWRRLTEHYRSLSDEELRELAADLVDLTEVAQQVLRDEMKMRGLSLPGATAEAPKPAATIFEKPDDFRFYDAPAASGADEGEESDDPVEYTWKTQLCECETKEQVLQLGEALRRAGIDSWVQNKGSRYFHVQVAADQLEQARVIAAQPIPQDIVDQLKADAEGPPSYFELPRCPSCGTDDPMLESADPSNQWRCEACGKQWIETETASSAESKD